MVIRVPLPKDLPHNNQRWHWSKRAQVVASIRSDTFVIARSALNAEGIKSTTEFRKLKLRLCRSKGQQLLDYDNAVTSMKPVLDGLQKAGVIFTDSPKYVEWSLTQEKMPDWRGVIVEVEDAEQ